MTVVTLRTRAVPGWLPRVARTRVRATDSPALAGGEWPLVTTRDPAGPIVATTRAVYHREQAAGKWVRLGWEQVERVHWDDHQGSLVLTGSTPDAPPQTVLAVPRNHALVALARERVAWTVLLSTHIPLTGYGHCRVTARRQPGTDRLLWRVVLGDGAADDPAVRDVVTAAVARLRTELGR
jgi:hypothetical protein